MRRGKHSLFQLHQSFLKSPQRLKIHLERLIMIFREHMAHVGYIIYTLVRTVWDKDCTTAMIIAAVKQSNTQYIYTVATLSLYSTARMWDEIVGSYTQQYREYTEYSFHYSCVHSTEYASL